MPDERASKRKKSTGEQPSAPDTSQPPEWAGIWPVGKDIVFISEPDPKDPDHVVHITWIRRPDAKDEVTDSAADTTIPTPVGTFRIPNQCDEATELWGRAAADLINFKASPEYEGMIAEAARDQARISEVQGQIDALDAQEAAAYSRLNQAKQTVDWLEKQIQWYNDELQKQQQWIKQLEEEIARLRGLQAEMGDPDKVFEGSIELAQAQIESAKRFIQNIHEILDALAVQLEKARQDLQKVADEIQALEEKRQQFTDDLGEAKKEAAIASDRERKVQAEYDRLFSKEGALAEVMAKCKKAQGR